MALGYFNTASARSVALGYNNTASGSDAFVAGSSNTASGQGAAAIGESNTAAGFGAFATGYGAAARLAGVHAASGYATFGAGGSQRMDWSGVASTTNATVTEIYGNWNAGERFSIPTDTLVFCTVHVAGIQQGASEAALFMRKVAIKNDGGTTALVGSVETIGTDQATASAGTWTVSITANDTNDAIKIEVTGVAATNIRWIARISGVELKAQ